MLRKSIVYGIIILFIGASVMPCISGANIRSIEGNEQVYAVGDMNFVKKPLAKGIVFEDDFDTGNTPGDDPVGWGVTEFINAEVEITDESYVSSPYSVKLDNFPGGGINIWHDFASTSKGTVECCVRSSADGCFISTNEELVDDWGILVTFWNGKIMYLDPSGFQDMDPPFTYTPDTWYDFRFEFDCGTDTYDISIDDNLEKQDALMKTPSTFFGNIWVSCEFDYVCTAYLDNVVISEGNNPPNIPDAPIGPTTLAVDESGTYSTSATDPDDDQVQYRFDWDADGSHDYSDWTDLVNSGTTSSLDHSWDTVGTYVVKAQSRDEYGSTSDWSSGLTVIVNNPPTIPDIDGPANGKAGTEYDYTFVSTDPDGDQIKYIIDWGDDTTDTTEFYNSGVDVTVSHTWSEQGDYILKAKAVDEYDGESDWGTLEVTMPRNKISTNPFLQLLEWFMNRFPLLEQIFQNV